MSRATNMSSSDLNAMQTKDDVVDVDRAVISWITCLILYIMRTSI